MIRDKSNYVKILLSVFFVVCVILPLIQMFANIDSDSYRAVVDHPLFGTAVGNSLKAASLATLISVALALMLSFCLARSNMRLKNMFKVVLTLPMLIPSISHGWGLTLLLGNNGILTKFFGFSEGIHGLTGIVMGSVMYSFPIAFLMLADVMGYEDAYPSDLSGGMRQRAAFLRTALCDADILLLDEPFGALDVITRGEMQDWLVSMRQQLGRTCLLVTHDIDEAIFLSDRILVMGGRPAAIRSEYRVDESNRTREWLYAQSELRHRLHDSIRGLETDKC